MEWAGPYCSEAAAQPGSATCRTCCSRPGRPTRARREGAWPFVICDWLRDCAGNVIRLIRDEIVEVDDPTGNGAGAVRNCSHLDLVRVLAWIWALQPNAGYLSVRYPRQSHETNEQPCRQEERFYESSCAFTIRGEMCWLARGGAKIRNLGLAAKVAYKRSTSQSTFENEQPRSFPRQGDPENVQGSPDQGPQGSTTPASCGEREKQSFGGFS